MAIFIKVHDASLEQADLALLNKKRRSSSIISLREIQMGPDEIFWLRMQVEACGDKYSLMRVTMEPKRDQTLIREFRMDYRIELPETVWGRKNILFHKTSVGNFRGKSFPFVAPNQWPNLLSPFVVTVTVYGIKPECSPSTMLRRQQMLRMYKYSTQDGNMLLTAANRNSTNSNSTMELEDLAESKEAGIRIDRTVLKSASPVFEGMLNSPFKECKEGQICIDTDSLQVIDDMVFFIVTGELREKADCLELLRISHLYLLKQMNYALMAELVRTLTMRSLVPTISAFDRYTFNDNRSQMLYADLIRTYRKNQKEWQPHLIQNKCVPLCWRTFGCV